MTIRTPYRTIAALGAAALAAILSSPNSSASTQTDGDSLTSGQEVTGGANAGDAVELAGGTVYVDEFTESALYYRIPRTSEESTVHVGISLPQDAGQESSGGFELELNTWDGDRCSSSSEIGSELNTRERLRSAHIAAANDPEAESGEDPCGEQDELVLTVGPTSEEAEVAGHAFELTVYEEPQPQDVSVTEPDYEDLDWTDIGRDVSGAASAEPATSFAEAGTLEPGRTYELAISPGELQIYRIPLEWGDRLQAEAFFPEPGDALSEDLSGMGSVSLAAMNPMRSIVSGEFSSLLSSSSTALRGGTPPVAWENRFVRNLGEASLPGDYYLVLAADEHDDGAEVSAPFMLTVDTFDDAGVEAPAYPADHQDAQPDFSGAGGNDTEEDDAGQAGDEVGTATDRGGQDGEELTALERIRGLGDSTGVVVSLAAFALLMLATGSLFMVRAIRQSNRKAAQPYQQPAPPQHWS